jgi:membrane-associated phospholipid phosphatase
VKGLIKKNLPLLLPYLLFLLLGGILITLKSKASIHLYINRFHNTFFDTFFTYYTFLGDGLFAAIIVLFLLFIRFRFALLVAVSTIISSGITQLLKRTVYADFVRPKLYFQNLADLYLVPGIDNNMFNSFPSGHATTAFATYFSLAFICKDKYLKFLFFIVALSVAFSRVYLSEHFFIDIYAGAMIGSMVTIFIFYFDKKSKWLNNAYWINSSLIKRNKNS